jgi:citrate lyase synthetase
MIIRGANNRDFKFIDSLYKANEFEFDTKHLEQIIVAEDSAGIIAVGTLVTNLEVSFVTVPSRSRKSRVLALTALINQVDIETANLGYKHVHAFVTNEKVMKILKDRFDFVKTKAIQVLVRFTKREP